MMSERSPSPEKKKPITDKCNRCNTRYKVTAENGIATNYTKQPECNFILCVCTNCSLHTTIFIGSLTMEEIEAQGIPIVQEDYADDITYKDWIACHGIELPSTYELTDRYEKVIANFGRIIDQMAPEMFFDNIAEETNKPYPDRWQ